MKYFFNLSFVFLLITSCHQSNSNLSINLDFESKADSLELLYPSVISTNLYERDFALSPTRDEIIFTLGNTDQSMRYLVSIKKENGVWGTKKVLPISGKHQDIEPFYSPDGSQLFFASNRPIYGDNNRSDFNIWVSKKQNDTWQEPTPLDSIINTKGQEYYPAITNSGNLYFTGTRKNGLGLEDIFMSYYINGKYQNPIVLDSTVNSKTYEFNAYVNPEETMIIYSSFGRNDGFGGGDLYISTKDANGNWTTARNLGKSINSGKLDFCPFYDEKTKTLYFSSLRTKKLPESGSIDSIMNYSDQPLNGLSNIFKISLDSISSK